MNLRKRYRQAVHQAKMIAAKLQAAPGQIFRSRRQDHWQYTTADLTPGRVKAILRTAAYGDPRDQDGVFNQLLERDAHLSSVYEQRLLNFTGPDWEIIAAKQEGKDAESSQALADETADYCREVLDGIEDLSESLNHLSEAVGRGLAAGEIVWDKVNAGLQPAKIEPIAFTQLVEDTNSPGDLRILTDDRPQGVPIDEAGNGKIILATPRVRALSPFRGGLLRTAVGLEMFKWDALRWWGIGLERFGLPLRIAKYRPGASRDEIDALLTMLTDMGVNAAGVFQQGAEVEFVESKASLPGGGFPHQGMIDYIDKAFTILCLGATLTTQMDQAGGSYGASKTHEGVIEQRRAKDIANESAYVRRWLLKPLVEAKFHVGAPVPYFCRVVEEQKDLIQTAQLISIVVNECGAELPASTIPEQTGLALVKGADLDAPLPGRAAAPDPFGLSATPPPSNEMRTNRLQILSHRKLTQVVQRRRTAISRTASWILAAVLASQAHTKNVMATVADFIDARPTNQQALADLPQVFSSLPIDDMVDLQNELLTVGRLAGRATAKDRLRIRHHAAQGRTLITHADASIGFARIPFEKAIEALRERVGLTTEEFEALDAEARSRAWRVAGVYNMQLLATVHRRLAESIAAGETARDFRLRVRDQMSDADGWTGENPWHADIVHYQNFAMAHAAGRYGEYQEAGVTHWRFVANGETCPICEPFLGKLFRMADRKAFPPIHFWCDCEDEPVFEGEFDDAETATFDDIKAPDLAAEHARPSGFKWDPAQYANLEPFDLRGFPLELQPYYAEFAAARGWEVLN